MITVVTIAIAVIFQFYLKNLFKFMLDIRASIRPSYSVILKTPSKAFSITRRIFVLGTLVLGTSLIEIDQKYQLDTLFHLKTLNSKPTYLNKVTLTNNFN